MEGAREQRSNAKQIVVLRYSGDSKASATADGSTPVNVPGLPGSEPSGWDQPTQISGESNSHPISPLIAGQTQTIGETVPETQEDSSSATPTCETSLVLPVYGTMGQRFTAYFGDLVVVYLIVFLIFFFSTLLGVQLPTNEGESQSVTFLALFVYMIIAQTSYHTTIGKYVHGLEVCSERPSRKYPSFWRILLRETLGRLFSSLFWGAGYWLAIKNPRRQAWSDGLAGTVVTFRRTNRVLTRALTAFVLVAFLVDLGVIGYGLYKEDRDKQYAVLSGEMESVTKDVISAREAVDQRLNDTKPVKDAFDFLVWQGQMKSLEQDLDRWESQIDRMQGLIQRGLSQNLAASAAEQHQLLVLAQVYGLRKHQAEKLREEADAVIKSSGSQASMASLRSDLQLIDSDIGAIDTQASQLLGGIGIK